MPLTWYRVNNARVVVRAVIIDRHRGCREDAVAGTACRRRTGRLSPTGAGWLSLQGAVVAALLLRRCCRRGRRRVVVVLDLRDGIWRLR
ncbi:MAG: hypothetical protein M5R36_16110 [Deltaproteobacteria bacterium]|nr:hypothetical protein [Deltaproteobacteria bacterium]